MLSTLASNCTAPSIPLPAIFGTSFLSIQTSLVSDYPLYIPEAYKPIVGDVPPTNLTFCNVTLTHTHPGRRNATTTQVWLPTKPAWNQRLQAVGGGGWSAGIQSPVDLMMAVVVASGYATVSTDGGTPTHNPKDWALLSPGNVDLRALDDWASVSLNDAALAAKSVVKSYYGQAPKYSYFKGCSQGGRQGLMFAQRYPDVFDGILASSPAIYLDRLLVSSHIPQQLMNEMQQFPHPSELNALTAAALKACDGLDGLTDGIIANPDACTFDPYTLVGTPVNTSSCSRPLTISNAAAVIADAIWNGARKADGSFLWYMHGRGARLDRIAGTTCSTNCTPCTAGSNMFTMIPEFIRLFAAKDPNFDIDTMSRRDWEHMYRKSVLEYEDILGTASPDLEEFREAGGKMITYHGLADEGVPYHNVRHYYDAVTVLDPQVHNFYRYFEAPGMEHCQGGIGGFPFGAFEALRKWVEDDVMPEVLEATSPTNRSSILCPYPKRAVFQGSDAEHGADGFVCE